MGTALCRACPGNSNDRLAWLRLGERALNSEERGKFGKRQIYKLSSYSTEDHNPAKYWNMRRICENM